MYYNDIDDNNTMIYADIELLKENKKLSDRVVIARLDRKNGLFGIIPVDIENNQILENRIKTATSEIEKKRI